MGKALIINGADFSFSGFNLSVETKEITTLKDYFGNDVNYQDLKDLPSTSGMYLYTEGINDTYARTGTNLSAVATTDYIDVEGFETIDYQGYIDNSKKNDWAWCVLFFYDSKPSLISGGARVITEGNIGVSSANSGGHFIIVGENCKNLYDVVIPEGAKYVRCCQIWNEEQSKKEVPFKLTLKKFVIQDGI